jgi:hypothetical protein
LKEKTFPRKKDKRYGDPQIVQQKDVPEKTRHLHMDD